MIIRTVGEFRRGRAGCNTVQVQANTVDKQDHTRANVERLLSSNCQLTRAVELEAAMDRPMKNTRPKNNILLRNQPRRPQSTGVNAASFRLFSIWGYRRVIYSHVKYKVLIFKSNVTESWCTNNVWYR
jgi:hypothetical protein